MFTWETQTRSGRPAGHISITRVMRVVVIQNVRERFGSAVSPPAISVLHVSCLGGCYRKRSRTFWMTNGVQVIHVSSAGAPAILIFGHFWHARDSAPTAACVGNSARKHFRGKHFWHFWVDFIKRIRPSLLRASANRPADTRPPFACTRGSELQQTAERESYKIARDRETTTRSHDQR